MSSASNVISFHTAKQTTEQELIDDIGARAFMFVRDEAAAQNLPIGRVIMEHMLGMAMVVEAVEGTEKAQELLAIISDKLGG
jgi:hypothetical protein